MAKEKTFILGVGAQKAGTSWLYEYIRRSPKANLGQLKEYQFWNMAFNKNSKKRHDLLNKPQLQFNSDDYLRWTMLTRKSLYEIYFNSIINSGYKITGDISPQYALLSTTHYNYIKQQLEACGFVVKVIYLIRDPIERLWSNIRMERNLYQTIDKNTSDSDAIKLFYKDDRWNFESKYDSIIAKLRDAFEKKNIYIGVYEEMFNMDKVRELSEFIGIDYDPLMIEKKVNSSKKTEELDTEVIKTVRKFYNETYEFCYLNFPQTTYLWNN